MRTKEWQESQLENTELERDEGLIELADQKIGKPIYYGGYQDNLAIWTYMDTTYRGGPGYVLGRDAHGRPLFAAHRKESLEEAQDRQLKSTCINYPKLLVDRFHGYLTKEPPLRKPKENSFFADFFQNVDGRGTTAVDFWSDICRRGLTTSPVWVVASTTAQGNERTAADAKQNNARFTLDWIHPSRIIDYELVDGTFTRVAILQEYRVKNGIQAPETVIRTIKELTAHEWRLWEIVRNKRGETTLVAKGEGMHGFNSIPIVPVFATSPDPECPVFSQSLIHNLADIARDIFRVGSLITEEAYNKVFTTLVLSGAKSKEINKSKNSYVISLSDAAAKAYPIGSDPSQLMVLIELQNQLTKTFFRVGHMEASGDPFDKRVAESGDKKSRDLEGLYQFLASLADGMERAENYLNRLVAEAAGEELVETNWPDEFDIKSLNEELDELEKYYVSRFPSTFIQEIQRAIMNRKIPRIREDIRSEIETELRNTPDPVEEKPAVADNGNKPVVHT